MLDLFIGHLYGDVNNKKINSFDNHQNLKKRKNFEFYKGQQKRDFIHIQDFRKLFKKILKIKTNKRYSKFDISSFKNYSIKSVILLIKKITLSNIDVNFGYFKYRKDFSIKGDIKTLKDLIGKKGRLLSGIKLLLREIKLSS